MRVAARTIAMLGVSLLISGCLPMPPKAGQNGPATASTDLAAQPAPGGDGTTVAPVAGPLDPRRTAQQFFQLEFYQLAVPVGTISGNAEFWKPFDETFLGLWQHDVLYKNGFRIGRAPLSELAALEGQLADAETTQNSLIGTAGKDVEMEVHTGVPAQTLFFFDRNGRLEGRDFERGDNLFAIGFRQVPRQPDHVRLSVAPAVREATPRLEREEGTGGIRWTRPRTIYALGIGTDLGVDECLVISPSDVALTANTLIGKAFMLEERPSQIVEKVLVIIPRLRGTLEEVKRGGAER